MVASVSGSSGPEKVNHNLLFCTFIVLVFVDLKEFSPRDWGTDKKWLYDRQVKYSQIWNDPEMANEESECLLYEHMNLE